MPRLFRALAVVEIIALLALGVALVLVAMHVTVGGKGSVWDIFTAVGTVGATMVALWLAARGILQERKATASLVSAWVTEDYIPVAGIEAYSRVVIVHIANESNEPVFDGHLSVVIGARAKMPLGPLTVPALPVIAQRRERVFDISMPLRSHDNTWDPRVELSFSDAHGRRWLRDADGNLSDVTGQTGKWVEGENDETALGRQDLQNPMFVALAFLAALRNDEGVDMETMRLVLAPEACVGWNATDWGAMREEYKIDQPTSMVDYPAPYIARVKLVRDPDLEGKRVEGERMELEVRYLTLTFAPDRGWRVWGVGNAVRPDEIQFPPGTF